MEKEYGMVKALGKLNDLNSYANALAYQLTGTGAEIINLAQDWFNVNISDLELCVKEYFGGDSEIIHEIDILKGYINYDVCHLKGTHEMRSETAKALITNQIMKIENLIKNLLAE